MTDPTEREPLSDKQEAAEGALSLAMMRLGAEPPCDVYDERGYVIWIKAVAAEITRFHRAEISDLRTALRAAEEREQELQEEWASTHEVMDRQVDQAVQERRAAIHRSQLWQEDLAAARKQCSYWEAKTVAAESSLTRYKTALSEIAESHRHDQDDDGWCETCAIAVAALEESPEPKAEK